MTQFYVCNSPRKRKRHIENKNLIVENDHRNISATLVYLYRFEGNLSNNNCIF